MTMQKRLNKLFKEWQTKHKLEPEKDLGQTKHMDVDKESFCVDGLINPNSEYVDVLYILKESNLEFDSKEGEKFYCNNQFWLREVIDTNILIPRRLRNIQEKVFKSSVDTMAFMNINKRGGAKNSSHNYLKRYAEVYKELIKKEIDIINPHKIVCCGDRLVNIIVDILGLDVSKYEIYTSYHPSYHYVDDDTFYNNVKIYVP